MRQLSSDDIINNLQIVTSTITNCEKIQPKFTVGTSSHTLLKNRIKAMYISKMLITEDSEIEQYSEEELKDALKPVVSIINKCEAGKRKHDEKSPYYKRFQKIINAMNISKMLILDEISKRNQ